MEKIGSQTRETIEELEGTYTQISGVDEDGETVIFNEVTQKYEKWVANDKHSGYVVVIDGVGYEFVRSL